MDASGLEGDFSVLSFQDSSSRRRDATGRWRYIPPSRQSTSTFRYRRSYDLRGVTASVCAYSDYSTSRKFVLVVLEKGTVVSIE
ncbi:hypothetical protein KCU65_g80, partial [Aureobasidium melanogenum]